MQKSISAVYLLLFHCLLVSIILVSHCHSDFGTSLQSDSLNLLDPVMASNIAKTKGKRYLQVDHTEHHNNQEMGRRIKSKRWMQVCEPMMIEADHVRQINNRVNVDASSINRLRQEEVAEISNENVNILHRCDKRIRSNQLSATLLADQRLYADRNSNASSTATIENHDGEQEMQQMSSDENFSTVFDLDRDDQIKSRTSKRRKQVSRSAMVTENQVAETINQNVSILENHDRLEVAQIIDLGNSLQLDSLTVIDPGFAYHWWRSVFLLTVGAFFTIRCRLIYHLRMKHDQRFTVYQ
ncbi:uncharacterized protein LOC133714912 [Rosa rugosa]|uniref:uncharacterized protein LOC133714912 n=1 Tax=Rosa rugosa TaxID=74645 RepID=UPI002B412A52|nr:uncharacterized protein LOC133714912 [Rosa rugosa]